MKTVKIRTPLVLYYNIRENEFDFVPDEQLAKLDGNTYADERFTDYIYGPLASIGLTEGTLSLSFQEDESLLFAVSTFNSPRPLTKEELKLLVDEVEGQISDGMGENYFQDLENQIGASIEIWKLFDSNRVSTISQK